MTHSRRTIKPMDTANTSSSLPRLILIPRDVPLAEARAVPHTLRAVASAVRTVNASHPQLRGLHVVHRSRLDGAVLFASETCALDIVGATLEREVGPGEIVAIGPDGVVQSSYPLERQALHRCVFEHVYFARPDSHVFGGSVDRARRALGRRLAVEHPAPSADLVFSVPDSSNSAALGFAETSGLPYELALIRNHYVGRTFIQPTQAGRDAKVKVKYNPVREVLDGKRVVMVDDSIVRGTTTRGLVTMVRNALRASLRPYFTWSPVSPSARPTSWYEGCGSSP